MYYADIKQYDVANGPGLRVSLFFSGCTHHCKNCFNEVAWDFHYGSEFTEKEADRIIEYMKPDYVRGITLLGGEPMEHVNQQGLLHLVRRIRRTYTQKDIWCFTGYLFDQDIMGRMYDQWPETKQLLACFDVMVDGKFVEEQKSMALRFKGSANQRTIDVQESLKQAKVVLVEGY